MTCHLDSAEGAAAGGGARPPRWPSPRAPAARPSVKVVAALSGGVDSAVAAARAVDQGHDVVGVHLALAADPRDTYGAVMRFTTREIPGGQG